MTLIDLIVKRMLTLSVYTLLPWSSTVYMRCILGDVTKKRDKENVVLIDCGRGPCRTGKRPCSAGLGSRSRHAWHARNWTKSGQNQKLFVNRNTQYDAVHP